MKRLMVLLAALALLAACNSEQVPAAARLSGTYEMVLVGNLVFVTSADKNELRVLDLAATPRDFVRAPNPIEPLSIPVTPGAVGLVKDLSYEPAGTDAAGREAAGPYVYAYSSAAISVVGVEALKELAKITPSDPITAIAAVGPGGDHPNGSVLYYATSNGTASTIYKVELPLPEALGAVPASVALPLSFDPISALLALPQTSYPAPEKSFPEQLVVATRKDQGRTGQTVVLSGGALERTLQFPYPVRLLATHPRAERNVGTEEMPDIKILSARQRVYGLLDEEACASSRACEGIMAVEVDTGAIATDLSGQPMLPIRPAQGLPLSLSLAAGKFVLVPNATLTTTPFPLLGMGSASDGKVFFFDAWSLSYVDAIPTPAGATSVLLQDPTGATQALDEAAGLTATTPFSVGEGIARDENIVVTYQGLIPGLVELPTSDAQGQQFKFPSELANRILVGDLIIPLNDSGPACPGKLLTVSQVIPPDTFETATPLPSECPGRTKYSLRAGATSHPFTVVGEVSGYLGRTGPGVGSTFLGPRYFRSGAGNTDPDVLLGFTMGDLDPRLVAPDWRYVVHLASNFDPLFFAASTTSFPGFYLPTSVVQVPTEATVLVSYPSANGILEFTPVIFGANQANSANIKVYQ